MKTNIQSKVLFRGATLLGLVLFSGAPASAANVLQTLTQGSGTNWNQATWGTPAAVPVSTNTYETPSGFAVRTTSQSTVQSFLGNQLQIDSGGTFYLKHSQAAATVNLVLNGGVVTYHGGPVATNCPVAGTLQVMANSIINSDQTAPNEDIWLQWAMSGSANLTLSNDTPTNGIFLFGTNTSFSGNWTNTGGFMEIGSGASNALGSGSVKLVNSGNSLIINATNNMVITNQISGLGAVTKLNTGSLVLGGNNTYTGSLTEQAGLLVLTGSGAQGNTFITSNSVMLIASSAALPNPSTLTISPNNAQTGGLQLSNNVTLSTGNPVSVAMRGVTNVAIESLSGNNVLSDPISLFSGGTFPAPIQADSGATLALNGGITCSVTGARGVLLQGAGNGSVAGGVVNGSATTVSLTVGGSGTWTVSGTSTYTGNTLVTNGDLKLGAGASITGTPVIEVDAPGILDASLAGGLPLGSTQLLRGSGSVLGNVSTTAGSIIQVGLTNQYGETFSLGNNLALGGGETIEYNFTTSANNVLDVTGSLTLGGSTTIQIFLPNGFAGNGTFRLINYSGTIQGGGSFTLNAPVSSQTFALDTSIPGQVNLIITGTPQNLVWQGDGTANVWDVGTTANWTGQYFNEGDNVTFNDSGSATPDINVAAPVQPGSVTITNSAEAYTFDGSGITTTLTFDKRGNNVVALTSSSNNFSGPIIIEAGTLSLGNGGTTGSLGNGPVTNNGLLLFNNSTNVYNMTNTITGSGSLQMTGGGVILNAGGSNSYTGGTTIGAGSQFNILNNNALGTTNTGTVVQSGGRVGFTSLGNWTVSQPVTINGYGLGGTSGALYANTIGNNATWTGPITIGSPSQIRIVNSNVVMTLSNTVIGSNQTLQCSTVNGGDILSFKNTFSLGSDPVLAALTKDGTGTMVLGGNSNLCGSVTVNAGTLEITTTNSPSLGNLTINTGALQLGSGLADGSMPTGSINLAAAGAMLIVNSSNNMTLSNALTGSGTLSKLDYGTLTIPYSNNFTGSVSAGNGTTAGGYINLQNVYGLGNGTTAQTVTLIRTELQLQGNMDIPASFSFQTSGSSVLPNIGAGWGLLPIDSLSGSNTIEGAITLVGGGNGTEISAASGTLTLNGSVTPNVSSRSLILSGAGTGVLNGAYSDGGYVPASGLIKQGPGTWTLNNANYYGGATTNWGGTLVLGAGGSIPNTPIIQLMSNGVFDVSAVSGGFTLGGSQTLGGIGSVAGNVNASGTVSPGPLGTLYFSNSLALSGLTIMELNRTNSQNADLISAAMLSFGGTLTVTNIGPAGLQAGDTFDLFEGAISGTFAATNLPPLPSMSLYWDTSMLNSGIIKVASSAVAPNAPTISAPGYNGTSFTLQVANSQVGFNYVLQSTPVLPAGMWTGVQTNAGTGGTLNFSYPANLGNPQMYFRISVQ